MNKINIEDEESAEQALCLGGGGVKEEMEGKGKMGSDLVRLSVGPSDHRKNEIPVSFFAQRSG